EPGQRAKAPGERANANREHEQRSPFGPNCVVIWVGALESAAAIAMRSKMQCRLARFRYGGRILAFTRRRDRQRAACWGRNRMHSSDAGNLPQSEGGDADRALIDGLRRRDESAFVTLLACYQVPL